MKSQRLLVACLLVGLSCSAGAIKPMSFNHPAKEARYEALLHELRCLVCQNQSLATSNAELAADMRSVVYRKIMAGKSNAQIKQFLVSRYGEFVLYQPPLSIKTWLLWFGPPVLVIVGLMVLLIAVRGRWQQATTTASSELNPDAEQHVQKLLDRHKDR